jgi:hypothetical protein
MPLASLMETASISGGSDCAAARQLLTIMTASKREKVEVILCTTEMAHVAYGELIREQTPRGYSTAPYQKC